MEILTTFLFFIFGTIVGSFLNVVILRFNTGGTLGGRSHCFTCGKDIAWYDLVPLWSFLFLGGTCRFCKSKISFQYPLVEFLAGLIFAISFCQFSPQVSLLGLYHTTDYLLFSISLIIYSLLIVIAVYDFRHQIIPDLLVFLFAIFALLKLFLMNDVSALFMFPGLLNLLAGPLLALPLFLLWLVSRGRWIGLGDAKLMLGVGWFLGFTLGASAMIIGFWIGALVSVLLLGLGKLMKASFGQFLGLSFSLKNLTIKSEVPLAPFLILGFFIAAFFKIDVLGLSSMFSI
ncbi:MAG: prepilin peptidase [Patescibacteria group bacterium]